MVELLLDRGADLEAKDNVSAATDAATALFRAVAFGHRATVKLLVDRGADLEAKDCVSAGTVCAARRIAECGLDGPGREAALGGMSGQEQRECGDGVCCAANGGVRDQPARDRDGDELSEHPAPVAGRRVRRRGCRDFWRAAWVRRGEVWRGHSTLQFGATSLDRAALRGHKETVELLLDRGADPEAKDHVSAVSLPAAQRVRKGDTGRPGTALEMTRQGVVLLWR
ncbi:unnamed protein product, partial [Symbiodinium sp. KB8]